MKLKLSFSAIFVALLIVFGSSTTSFGQTDQITGGYGDADVKDAEVIKAAKFAVTRKSRMSKSIITLVSIKNAQMQVVAGLNYKFCLQVKVKKPGKKAVWQFAQTVVYRNLKNRYSLTSWTVQKVTDCQ